jgi:hypothetical protein
MPARFAPLLAPGDPKRRQALLEQVASEMRAELRSFKLTAEEPSVDSGDEAAA